MVAISAGRCSAYRATASLTTPGVGSGGAGVKSGGSVGVTM